MKKMNLNIPPTAVILDEKMFEIKSDKVALVLNVNILNILIKHYMS